VIHYKKLRLKVLQGINKGAIASFLSESVIIGSSPECDIVLSGFTTSEPRIEISYIDNCLELKVINKSIMIDGVLIKASESSFPLKLYQLISFDTCCLTIGEQGKDWPSCKDNKDYIEPKTTNKQRINSLLPRVSIFKIGSTTNTVGILFSLFVVTFSLFLYLIKAKIPENLGTLKTFSSQAVISDFNLKSQKNTENTHDSTIEKLAYGLLQTYGVNRINLRFQKKGILIASGYVEDSMKWEMGKGKNLYIGRY
jgi:hypothetical protein